MVGGGYYLQCVCVPSSQLILIIGHGLESQKKKDFNLEGYEVGRSPWTGMYDLYVNDLEGHGKWLQPGGLVCTTII